MHNVKSEATRKVPKIAVESGQLGNVTRCKRGAVSVGDLDQK